MEQPYVDTTNVGGNEYKIRDTEIRKILTPEYNTENSYTLDDLVMYEGKLYVCIEENQGIWNDTQWQEITLSEYLDFVNEKYLGLTKKLVQAIGVLENLQTAFKENLVGAVNENNEKISENKTKIEENKTKIEDVSTDLASKIGRIYTGSLNDLRTPGLYWCTMSDVTQRPVDSAGSVEVVTDNGSYVTQVYTALGNNQYIRGRNGATGNWSEWTHLASRDYANQQATNAKNEAIGVLFGKELSAFNFSGIDRVIFGGGNYTNTPSYLRWITDMSQEEDFTYQLVFDPTGQNSRYEHRYGGVYQKLFTFLTNENLRGHMLGQLGIRTIQKIKKTYSVPGNSEQTLTLSLSGFAETPILIAASSNSNVMITSGEGSLFKPSPSTIIVKNYASTQQTGYILGLLIEVLP